MTANDSEEVTGNGSEEVTIESSSYPADAVDSSDVNNNVEVKGHIIDNTLVLFNL